MIATCAGFGVATARVPGRSGVWLRGDELRQERKVGAIGLRVSRGVTMHGIALNCDVDLGWYDRFVPCGIADAGVTTLSLETGRPVGVPEVLPVLQARLSELLAWWPYTATPDYDPRPDPARRSNAPQPRIELVRP
jgi:lipoyl(octanoyl) transferase